MRFVHRSTFAEFRRRMTAGREGMEVNSLEYFMRASVKWHYLRGSDVYKVLLVSSAV